MANGKVQTDPRCIERSATVRFKDSAVSFGHMDVTAYMASQLKRNVSH